MKRIAEFAGTCCRGFWLAFLALALLTVSVPTATALTFDKSPAVTSKRGDNLAIPRQDIPLNLLSDHGSKPGWSRAAERNGAAQPPSGHGIVAALIRTTDARPYPGASYTVPIAIDGPRFRPFDAQAPPA